MSVVTPADIEGVMATGLKTAALQGVIDREEDWLANDSTVGIGQLVGERDQTVYRPGGSRDPILLPRPTDSVDVTDNGTAVDVLLLDGGARVEPVSGRWRGPAIVLTYTPTDQLRVEAAIFELVRIRISASPVAQESAESHSYSRGPSLEARRDQVARGLHPQLGLTHSLPTHGRRLTSSR